MAKSSSRNNNGSAKRLSPSESSQKSKASRLGPKVNQKVSSSRGKLPASSLTKSVQSKPSSLAAIDQSSKLADSSAPSVAQDRTSESALGDASNSLVAETSTYKWWENEIDDSEIRWTSLEHAGVMFPPVYEPLPKHVHLYYDGKPIWLPPAAEEVAGFFGAILHSDHVSNPVFQQNFWGDFLEVLQNCNEVAKFKDTDSRAHLVDFAKCDFTAIHNYYQAQSEAKKALPAAVKKQARESKMAEEEPYRWCTMDGRRQPVGNFRVEPPSLFRGRGNHPKTGKLKARVQPEDVIINIGQNAPIPKAPDGHSWGAVQHDQTVVWLAAWKENINGAVKYVRLANNSDIKGISDFRKFEKARELKHHIDTIRNDYLVKLTSTLMDERQRATAMYLIDVLALRAGSEKGDDEADTVGCCSLRCEHLKLEQPNLVTFDFLGKDSVRFYQQVKVDRQVFLNLKIFTREPKKPSDDVFDRLDTEALNKHLRQYMPGLTAKVFRTYNASLTMQKQIDKIPRGEGTIQERVVAYNAANRAVAILCNHQRNVGQSHDKTVESQEDRIEEMVWQRQRLKRWVLHLDPQQKSKRKAWFSELRHWPAKRQAEVARRIVSKQRERLNRKREKQSAVEESMETDESYFKEKLEECDAVENMYIQEAEAGQYSDRSKLPASIEKADAQISKLDSRISTARLLLQDRRENSSVALTTSKINYIDPRLTSMYAKRYEVPVEKLFNKTLREKFAWAFDSVDENWTF